MGLSAFLWAVAGVYLLKQTLFGNMAVWSKTSDENMFKPMMVNGSQVVFTKKEMGFSSCRPDQPVYQKTSQAFEEKEFSKLYKDIYHLLEKEERQQHLETNALSDAVFANTRGIVLNFNTDGIDDMKKDFPSLVPIFDKLCLEGPNAWVLNILVCKAAKDVSQKSLIDKSVVNWHVDNTLAMDRGDGGLLAHEVSVFYLNIPEDIIGGNQGDMVESLDDSTVPDKEVPPETNSIVRFRGDAIHRVLSYMTNGDTERVSIVLEQYAVPLELYVDTTRYRKQLGDHRFYFSKQTLRDIINYGGPLLIVMMVINRFLIENKEKKE